MRSNKISIKIDDIFSSDAEAIVIPRSTTGTIRSSFTRGLHDKFEINISEPLPFRELGSVDIQQINGPYANQLSYIIFATCVDQNSGRYDAIEKIISEIAAFSKRNPRLRDIAIPLLGTGAGRLNYIEVYNLIFQIFEEKSNNSCHLFIYVLDNNVYRQILDFEEMESIQFRDSTRRKEINSAADQSIEENTKTFKMSITPKLHSDSFSEIDFLNHDFYAEAISEFIKNKSTFPPLCIGIFAPWGKGKTTLMKFIKNKLDVVKTNDKDKDEDKNADKGQATYENVLSWIKENINLNEKLKNPTIWFNAWKFQNTEQIWAGFAYEIIQQLVSKLSKKQQAQFWLLLNIKRIDSGKIADKIRYKILGKVFKLPVFLIGTISAILLNIFTSTSFLLVSGLWAAFYFICYEWVKRNRNVDLDTSKYIKQPEYENKMGYFHLVEGDLGKALKLLVDKDNPAIIFIDDLDRCSPKIVAEVVEAINLFINGDYPDCYFILGQDAQMVSAALDTAYANMGSKLNNIERSYGSLGWYFMEKFIQLPFNIPNITDEQSKNYLQSLLTNKASNSSNSETNDHSLFLADIQNAQNTQELMEISLKTDDIVADYIKSGKENQLVEIRKHIINKAGKLFDDDDSEITDVIYWHSNYLTGSPRLIKRFVNLYRFYRFIQFASLDKSFANIKAKDIASWIIISIRWPRLVRCIQWNTEGNYLNGTTPQDRAKFFDEKISDHSTFDSWAKSIEEDYQNNIPWLKDPTLFDFIKNISTKDNKLQVAVQVGFW